MLAALRLLRVVIKRDIKSKLFYMKPLGGGVWRMDGGYQIEVES